jgi:predicted acylesterase/phospholipase RssA
VIKVLEEYHVPVDLVVGTSMGSIVGGLYASGWSVDEIEAKITTIDWGSVFVDKLQRQEKTFRRKEDDARFLIPLKMRFKKWKPYFPPSVIGGQNLELLFQGLAIEATGETDFDRFPIPYRAVATDLSDGRAVVLKSGSLATAMRASMSLPGIFPPVELDGKPLSDGGMAANFPIRIARALGADVIIGVDITTPLRKKEQLGNLLTRIDQVTSLLTNANKEADMAFVEPQDASSSPSWATSRLRISGRRGNVVTARSRRGRRDLPTPGVGRRWQCRLPPAQVRRSSSDRRKHRPWRRHRQPPHRRPDQAVAEQADLANQLIHLYGLDVFGPIRPLPAMTAAGRSRSSPPEAVQPEQPAVRVLHGAASMELQFDLAMSHLFLPVNRQGGVAQHSPVRNEYAHRDRVLPAHGRRSALVFDTAAPPRPNRCVLRYGDALAQYIFTTTDLTGFGRPREWGQVGLGAFRRGEGHKRIGIDALPSINTDDGGLNFDFRVDTLNSVTWPRHEPTSASAASGSSRWSASRRNYAGIVVGHALHLR